MFDIDFTTIQDKITVREIYIQLILAERPKLNDPTVKPFYQGLAAGYIETAEAQLVIADRDLSEWNLPLISTFDRLYTANTI